MVNSRLGLGRQKRLVGLVSAGVVVTGLLAGFPAAGAGAVSGGKATGTSVGAATADSAADSAADYTAGRYVVLLRDPAVAAYAGGLARYPATRAKAGSGFRADTQAARAYARHLRGTQRSIAEEVGVEVERSYTVASNGFVADLTAGQALELATDRRVLLVSKDVAREKDTWNTPKFLGLSGRNGAWTRNGGQARAGDGTVVGVLDSGIWPESGSFRGARLGATPKTKWDITMRGTATRMEKVDGGVFTGECEPGENWAATDCNTKIIGARYYPEAFLESVEPEDIAPTEHISTRDGDGHGTHTAGTAAGGVKKNVTVEGRKFGQVSGMAPAARLAIYKVCWEDTNPNTGGCYNSAILGAIDDAVADGVDVINFSISGALDTVVDPVEVAFEGAAEAGVFIATSAGNSGPGASTVAHNSPWLTTVAASTHTSFENTLVLGNGRKVVGASIAGSPVPSTRLVRSTDVAMAGADADEAALCVPGTLDPAKARGAMVICNRGAIDRVAKSAEVKRAGGKAMVLANVTEGSLDADFHSVPTVHVAHTATPAVLKYVEAAGSAAKARIVLGNTTKQRTPVPQAGGFSSRGPALANASDILKPDISAPGVSVLAAVAPPTNSGRRYDLYSGTSMASPHIAGLAAFVLGRRPSWTPMEVKSAMMLTATRVRDADGKLSNDVFAQGAGQVRPRAFLNPGLFVTSDAQDWRGFLTGQGLDTGVPAVEASALNMPSMAKSGVTYQTVIKRSFRATRAGTWKIKARVPGFDVKLSRPSVKSTRRNDVVDVTFRFSRTTAAINEWTKGWIVLSGPTTVRMPVALEPVIVEAPVRVQGEGVQGSITVPVTAGITGSIDLRTEGLAKAQTDAGTVAAGEHVYECVVVPEGTSSAHFDLDAVDDTADLDMYVYKVPACDSAEGDLVGQSATGSADEEVVLDEPEAGTYVVDVEGYAAGRAGDPIAYSLNTYNILATGGWDVTVSPDPVPVTRNEQTSYRIQWTNLDPASSYRGYVHYEGSDEPTLVEISTGAAAPGAGG